MVPPRPPGVTGQRWLWAAVRAGILDGRLPPGSRLPGTRELARQYGVARGTVVAAFEQLHAEGYVDGRVGAGTFVARSLPDDLLSIGRDALRTRTARPTFPLRRDLAPVQALLRQAPAPPRAFRTNEPAVDMFPTTLWAQLAARRHRRATAADLLGGDPAGHPPLRRAIAAYLSTSRGVACDPGHVVVVSGVQEALDLLGRLLVRRGDRVGVEDPGYTGAVALFATLGARVESLSVDEEGAVPPGRARTALRLAYLTPAHQFPLGMTMSLRRRLAWLDWARANRAVVIEDDYDGEFRYRGRPMPALQGLDGTGLVAYVGSLSKVLFPSLRLGYLIVPDGLVDAVAALKAVTTRHEPVLDQIVLCDFLEGGHFGRHLRRMREVYAERLAALLDSVQHRLAGRLAVSHIDAGLQTTARIVGQGSTADLIEAAAARWVELTPLEAYERRVRPSGMLLMGFAAVEPREIRRGVRELAALLDPARPRADGGILESS